MATDIKVSELNEITSNKDVNQIIVNDRQNASDSGVTKKIQVSNLLTANMVREVNIQNLAVTSSKLSEQAVTCNKIQNKSITCNQIKDRTICSELITCNTILPNNINTSEQFTFNSVVGTVCFTAPTVNAESCLKVTTGNVGINGINYTFPTSEVPGYFLKTDGGGGLTWAEAAPGAGTSLVFEQIFPVGTIIPYAGSSTVPNDKWLVVDGSQKTFDGIAYPALSAVLGTTWGPRYTDAAGTIGNESSTGRYFTLPNLGGRVVVGTGTGYDVNGTSCAITQGLTGGEYTHTLSQSAIPAHQHLSPWAHDTKTNCNRNICDSILAAGKLVQGPSSHTIDTPGELGSYGMVDPASVAQGHTHEADYAAFTTRQSHQLKEDVQVAHNNMQTYVGTRYIIKAKNDNIQEFAVSVGQGLSATDGTGAQTTTLDLSSTNIGIKANEEQFNFDGSNKLTLRDPVKLSSPTLGEFSAVEACAGGTIPGLVNQGQNYLRAWTQTTGCLNYTEDGTSFVCIGNGSTGATYYPENTTASKTCAKICFQQPGIYNVCYTGPSVEWEHLAYMCASVGGANIIGKDMCGNIVVSDHTTNVGAGNDGQNIGFNRTIYVDQPGCAYIFQRIINGCGFMGYGYGSTSFDGIAACSIFGQLKITRMNHLNSCMTPTTAAMTSFFA